MKKRFISLLLSIVFVFTATVPAMSYSVFAEDDDDGGDGIDILGLAETGGKFYTAIKKTVGECDSDTGFGEAFVKTMKNLGKSLAGIEDEEDPPEGATQTVVNIDLTEVNESIGNITNSLTAQSRALKQMSDEIQNGFSQLNTSIDNIKWLIEDSTRQIEYSGYLDTFFTFYNSFYQAISKKEEALISLYKSGNEAELTPNNIKNTNDGLYTLSGYDIGNLCRQLETLDSYLNGTYKTIASYTGVGSASVINIMCEYLALAGYSSEQIAETIESFITEVYYVYMLGNYYYSYLCAYQILYIEENKLEAYSVSVGTAESNTKTQIADDSYSMMTSALKTTAVILSDLQARFVDYSDTAVGYITPLGYYLGRSVEDFRLNVEAGSRIYLPDAKTLLGGTFSEKITAMADISYEYTVNGPAVYDRGTLVVNEDAENGSEIKLNLVMREGKYVSATVISFTFTVTDSYIGNGNGYGDYSYPFIIASVEDYNNFVNFCNSGEISYVINAYQVEDLDFGGETIQPVNSYLGNYYGNGHYFKNARVSVTAIGESTDVGIFKSMRGSINDVYFENITVVANELGSSKEINAGIIFGSGSADVYRCTVKKSNVYIQPYGEMQSGQIRIGGIAGYIIGGVYDSAVENVTIEAYDHGTSNVRVYAGGIAGYSYGYYYKYAQVQRCGVVNCYICRFSDCVSDENDAVGGFIGEMHYTDISDCFIYMLSGSSQLYCNGSGNWGVIMGHCAESYRISLSNVYVYTGENANYMMTGIAYGGIRDGYGRIYSGSLDTGFRKNVSSLALGGLSDGLRYSYYKDGGETPVLGEIEINVSTENANLKPVFGDVFNPGGIQVKQYINNREMTPEHMIIKVSDVDTGKSGETEATVTALSGNTEKITVTVDASKHEHTYEEVERIGSCTEAGYIVYRCVCGTEYRQKVKAGEIHNFVNYVYNNDATCEHDGTETAKCEDCNILDTRTAVGTQKFHNPGEWEIETESTCIKKGERVKRCTECETIIEREELPLGEHKYVNFVSDGKITHTCEVCGENYSELGEAPADAAVIELSSGTAASGKTFTVEAKLKNNPGFNYIKIKLSYDASVLSVKKCSSYVSANLQTSENITDNPYIIILASSGNIAVGEKLFDIEFDVADTAKDGKTAIEVSYLECYDENDNEVEFFITGGELGIESGDAMPGDINGDGKIKGNDATLLLKYLAEWDVTIIKENSDCNGDGKIKGNDVTLLLKYLAEWDVSLG